VSVVNTRSKEFTLPSSSGNHINILIDISLRTVDNSNPRVLKPIGPSIKNLQRAILGKREERKGMRKQKNRGSQSYPSMHAVLAIILNRFEITSREQSQ